MTIVEIMKALEDLNLSKGGGGALPTRVPYTKVYRPALVIITKSLEMSDIEQIYHYEA